MEVISQDLKFSKPRRRFMGFASKEGAGEGELVVKERERRREKMKGKANGIKTVN
jgi:hypothetical protein